MTATSPATIETLATAIFGPDHPDRATHIRELGGFPDLLDLAERDLDAAVDEYVAMALDILRAVAAIIRDLPSATEAA
jgi:hypothetical protein